MARAGVVASTKSWRPLLAVAGTLLLVLVSCTRLKDVEVENRCAETVVVDLWEAPTPRATANKVPSRVEVGPASTVVVKDALADVDEKGSSAEIVSGSRAGAIVLIPHGGKLKVSIC